MFGRAIKLFKIFGFQVSIDWTWLIVMGLIVWSLAGAVFPAEFHGQGLTTTTYIIMGVAAAVGLFFSIVVHELCHSLVAKRFGLPMNGITLFLFGGMAEMSNEPPSPKAEFWIAIAGPASSVVVAGVFFGLSVLGAAVGWPATITAVLSWIAVINAILVVFNLIPGYPMDGGRVLRSALWAWKHSLRRATHIASRIGAGFGMALIILGFVELLLLRDLGGIWMILIGMFLRSAAKQSYRQVLIREILQGEHVRDFMNDQPMTVGPHLDIEHLVSDHVYRLHHKMFPVVDDGMLVGRVTTQQLNQVPQAQWRDHEVAEVTEPASEENTISVDEDAMIALTKMSRGDDHRLMVVDGNKLVGVISLKDMLKFLSLKLELERDEQSGVAAGHDGNP